MSDNQDMTPVPNGPGDTDNPDPDTAEQAAEAYFGDDEVTDHTDNPGTDDGEISPSGVHDDEVEPLWADDVSEDGEAEASGDGDGSDDDSDSDDDADGDADGEDEADGAPMADFDDPTATEAAELDEADLADNDEQALADDGDEANGHDVDFGSASHRRRKVVGIGIVVAVALALLFAWLVTRGDDSEVADEPITATVPTEVAERCQAGEVNLTAAGLPVVGLDVSDASAIAADAAAIQADVVDTYFGVDCLGYTAPVAEFLRRGVDADRIDAGRAGLDTTDSAGRIEHYAANPDNLAEVADYIAGEMDECQAEIVTISAADMQSGLYVLAFTDQNYDDLAWIHFPDETALTGVDSFDALKCTLGLVEGTDGLTRQFLYSPDLGSFVSLEAPAGKIIVIEPMPEPTPEPTPEPVPEPDPDPEPDMGEDEGQDEDEVQAPTTTVPEAVVEPEPDMGTDETQAPDKDEAEEADKDETPTTTVPQAVEPEPDPEPEPEPVKDEDQEQAKDEAEAKDDASDDADDAEQAEPDPEPAKDEDQDKADDADQGQTGDTGQDQAPAELPAETGNAGNIPSTGGQDGTNDNGPGDGGQGTIPSDGGSDGCTGVCPGNGQSGPGNGGNDGCVGTCPGDGGNGPGDGDNGCVGSCPGNGDNGGGTDPDPGTTPCQGTTDPFGNCKQQAPDEGVEL